jgi:HD-like signal output (HDOD) protein
MNEVQFSAESLLRVAQAFPATPRIMADLGRLLRDPHTELEAITAYLKHDTALAARLLRVANSAAFAQKEPVASMDDAAALIGFQEIHRLVGAVAIDQFSKCDYPLYGFTGPQLRENALLVALLMEELANPTDQDPHIAYSSGLFRSIGKLALEKLGGEGEPLTGYQQDRDSDLVMWEKHTFGTSANASTAVILQHWHFPPEIANTIHQHFTPSDQSRLTHLLNLAANIAERRGYGLPGEQRYWLDPEAVHRELGIDERYSQRYVDRALETFERVKRAFT